MDTTKRSPLDRLLFATFLKGRTSSRDIWEEKGDMTPEDNQKIIRKDKEICRLGRKPPFLPVGIQRRRSLDRRAPRAERLSARTPPDSRRPVLDGPPLADLLAGESVL